MPRPATRPSRARRFGKRSRARCSVSSAMRRSMAFEAHALAALEADVVGEVGVLADARAVVHQADHAHARMVGHPVEQRHDVHRRLLAAQMQEMLGFEQAGAGQRIEVGDAVAAGLGAAFLEAEIAEAERVEHGRDPRRRALRVVGDEGGAGRPARVAARLHLAFQIVGVGVHDAGDQVVAAAIERQGGGRRGPPAHPRSRRRARRRCPRSRRRQARSGRQSGSAHAPCGSDPATEPRSASSRGLCAWLPE